MYVGENLSVPFN